MIEPRRYLTPRQRIAAGVVTVCCGIAVPVVTYFEGRVNTAYADPVLGWKVPTACVGSTKGIKRGDSFTDAECDELLKTDLHETYTGLLKCIGDVPMPDHELAAFLSFSFNVGPGAFCKGSFPAKLNAGDHASACALLTQYRFVAGKDCAVAANKCSGIVRRRTAERNLCEGKA